MAREDLEQVGMISMVKGIQDFDTSHGVKLKTFLFRVVDYAIHDAVRCRYSKHYGDRETYSTTRDDNTVQEFFSYNESVEHQVIRKEMFDEALAKVCTLPDRYRDALIAHALEQRITGQGNNVFHTNCTQARKALDAGYVARRCACGKKLRLNWKSTKCSTCQKKPKKRYCARCGDKLKARTMLHNKECFQCRRRKPAKHCDTCGTILDGNWAKYNTSCKNCR